MLKIHSGLSLSSLNSSARYPVYSLRQQAAYLKPYFGCVHQYFPKDLYAKKLLFFQHQHLQTKGKSFYQTLQRVCDLQFTAHNSLWATMFRKGEAPAQISIVSIQKFTEFM